MDNNQRKELIKQKVERLKIELKEIDKHHNEWNADDVETYSEINITWNGSDYCVESDIVEFLLEELETKTNALKEIKQGCDPAFGMMSQANVYQVATEALQ